VQQQQQQQQQHIPGASLCTYVFVDAGKKSQSKSQVAELLKLIKRFKLRFVRAGIF